jgi:CRP-like cAMP-binding protein
MRKAMTLMGALDDNDVNWLAVHGKPVRLASGEVFVREGVPVDALFFVLDGKVAVTSGKTRVATLLAGEVVGEISFADGRPPAATVQSEGAAQVLAVDRALLRTKLSEDPSFAAHFYRALAIFLADRLRATTAKLAYGPNGNESELGDDLGDDLLETVSMGTQRFDRFLRQISGGR